MLSNKSTKKRNDCVMICRKIEQQINNAENAKNNTSLDIDGVLHEDFVQRARFVVFFCS